MNNSNIPDKIYNIFNSQTIEEAISKVDNEVKKADMKKGLEMENTLKPLFETKFGFLNKTHHYHSFDFENENVLIELKTRNVDWLRYDSLMFSMKKIEYLRKNNITKLSTLSSFSYISLIFLYIFKIILYYYRIK